MDSYFPYQIDGRGRTREARRDELEDEYIKGLIEQVLFTSPGERVMRPDFGSGIQELLFSANTPQLATTTQMLVQAALQQWLGQYIVVENVSLEAIDSTLFVEILYTLRRSQKQQSLSFEKGIAS